MATDNLAQASVPSQQPQSVSDFQLLLQTRPGFDWTVAEGDYELLAESLRAKTSKSDVWLTLLKELETYANEYYLKTGLELFYKDAKSTPDFIKKPFDSFVEKVFRYAFIKNRLPKELPAARGGIPLPEDYYLMIDDIVRTTVVVKFLDGVELLIKRLDAICTSHGVKPILQYKCSDEGYFAAHYYLPINLDLSFSANRKLNGTAYSEIQITTQLQEVLRRFLHFQYEKDRGKNSIKSNVPWQWRYREDSFFTNYLGHTLRSIEGQIMDARRRRDIADACI